MATRNTPSALASEKITNTAHICGLSAHPAAKRACKAIAFVVLLLSEPPVLSDLEARQKLDLPCQ